MLLRQTPCEVPYRPVSNVALAGAQTGWLVMGRTNRVPDRARRSSSGVRSIGCPLQPSVSHRCWSAKITRMFGLLPVIAHL